MATKKNNKELISIKIRKQYKLIQSINIIHLQILSNTMHPILTQLITFMPLFKSILNLLVFLFLVCYLFFSSLLYIHFFTHISIFYTVSLKIKNLYFMINYIFLIIKSNIKLYLFFFKIFINYD